MKCYHCGSDVHKFGEGYVTKVVGSVPVVTDHEEYLFCNDCGCLVWGIVRPITIVGKGEGN